MDDLVRGNSEDGSVRVFVAVTTELVGEMRRIHQTSATASAALGRLLTAAAIMGAQLKGDDDSVTIQVNGDGTIGMLAAVSDSLSHVRGYAENPYADFPANEHGKLNVGRAVGKGFISVIRDLGLKEPYIGRTPIVSGEIAEDLTYYYAKSEQIPTAMALGVLVDTDLSIKAAGGYLIQLMPEARDEDADRLTELVGNLPSVTDMIMSGMGAEDIASAVTKGFDMKIMSAAKPLYECKCSRERMERALISIGKRELRAIIDEQGCAEMTCRFCDRKYSFDKACLESLYEKAKG